MLDVGLVVTGNDVAKSVGVKAPGVSADMDILIK